MEDFKSPWRHLEPEKAAKPPAKSPARSSRLRTLVIYLVVALLGGAGIWALMQAFPGRFSAADDWSVAAYRVGFLALVTASLFAQRLRLGQVLRYGAYWTAVAGMLLLGYSYRGELGDAALRMRAELIPGYAVSSGDHEMILAEGEGGAYTVMGRIDGRPIRFVIDTGASDIVLTPTRRAAWASIRPGCNFAAAMRPPTGWARARPSPPKAWTWAASTPSTCR